MKRKTIILAVGGTGGHLFPARQLAQNSRSRGFDVLFLGTGLSSSKFFNRREFDFYDISSATFNFKKPLSVFIGLCKVFKGLVKSVKLILKHNPDFIVGFGSYHSFPILLAAVLLKVNIIIHEQNVYPGKVNRMFSRFAKAVGLTFPDVYNLLKCQKKRLVSLTKTQGHLDQDITTIFSDSLTSNKILLVFGGSLGSVAVNRLFMDCVPLLLSSYPHISVIHMIGENEDLEKMKTFYRKLKITSLVKTFDKNMVPYFAAADLAICRAGAGTLKELIEYELPAVMIPYPHAYNHQEKNALFLRKNIEGGVFFKESELSSSLLSETIVRILSTSELSFYKANLRKYREKCEHKDFLSFITEVSKQV